MRPFWPFKDDYRFVEVAMTVVVILRIVIQVVADESLQNFYIQPRWAHAIDDSYTFTSSITTCTILINHLERDVLITITCTILTF